ncbi:MAG: MBL fold metallo-hydrolase [Candidatus Cloacimonadota bacterium]|nr:MBL fold metallo-hydrolase [Candidatus Cloacimonadota bacterium]
MGLNKKRINIFPIKSGHFWADAGSVMGTLPKILWYKKIQTDSENRVRLDINLLLIQIEDSNILIDTGIGNRNINKIPSRFKCNNELVENKLLKFNLTPAKIDTVVLTHLHFDHAGGIYDKNGNLTFNRALHLVQKKEWLAAQDKYRVDACSYKTDLTKLENSGKLQIIDGTYKISDDIKLKLVSGHSAGMQIVEIKDEKLFYFCSDLFPLFLHKSPQITSASDICRQQVYEAKKEILLSLRKLGGRLYFGHQTGRNYLEF